MKEILRKKRETVYEDFDEGDLHVKTLIERMPDRDPPPDLVLSVMKSLQPKKLSRWRRAYFWAVSPRSITVTPFRWIAAAALIVVLVFPGLLVIRQKAGQPLQLSGANRLPVIFSVQLPGVRSVSVIGTFNGWKAQGYEMELNKEQETWSITVWLPEGRHEYGFLVDGRRVVPDPRGDFYQNDGFGNQNSVLIVKRKDGEST